MNKSRASATLSNIVKAAALPVIIYVVFFIATRIYSSSATYGNLNHLAVVLRQVTPSLFMAMGMSFNMFAGRWDFSYGSMAVLGSIIGGQVANSLGLNSIGMMAVCVLVCVACAFISGMLYIKLKLPALVVSLGMVQIYEMISNVIYGGEGATVRGDVTNLAVLPTILIVCAVVFVIYYIVMNKTRFGYNVRSIGGGQEIARNIGINVPRNALGCYVVGGIFIGLSAYMTLASNGTQRAVLNLSSATTMFDAMICVIIGTYIQRYCNVAVAVFIGVASMRLLIAGLLGIGLSSQMQSIIKGAFLLAFIAFSKNQYKIQERKMLHAQAAAANAKYAEMQKTGSNTVHS